jgi:hypothetical protein
MSIPVTVTVRRKILKIFNNWNFYLYVSAHPESKDRAIIAGHRLILSCEIQSGINGMFLGTLEWFHNGSPLIINSLNRNRIDYRNGTLTIDQTSVKHFIS